MSSKRTLQTLMDNLIKESLAPFSAEEFLKKVQEVLRKNLPADTLNNLKQNLSSHDYLIGLDSEDYLPYSAVLEKINHIPLSMAPGKLEFARKLFIPGHRLLPFLSRDCLEKNLTILDPEGRPVPKRKESFFIEDVVHFYQYFSDRHFPDEIKVNEKIPGKSFLVVPAWDMKQVYSSLRLKPGEVFGMRLVDFEGGVFQIFPNSRKDLNRGRLKMRSLHVALEEALLDLCEDEQFCTLGLEKQLMRAFFAIDADVLKVPGFSLIDFLESLKDLTLLRDDSGNVQLASLEMAEAVKVFKSEPLAIPKGRKGSLEKIFQDLHLAFHEAEFKAILYSVMGTEKFKPESVFQLLFGGEGKLFFDNNQHGSFYSKLRKMLHDICDDLKAPESLVVSELRDKTVEMKLGLIGILRFLEEHQVGLEDLPEDTLEQVADLDRFCSETLTELSNRNQSPDLNFVRDTRLALRIIQPHMDSLEEEIYCRLGFF
jgi:hypothetical protein